MGTIFTSESVTEGHPDKVADLVSDAIVDAFLTRDPASRVACETLCKGGEGRIGAIGFERGIVVVAGEITSEAEVDYESVVRKTIKGIGYDDPAEPFSADGVRVDVVLTPQAREIGAAAELGAGDQGLMFGYATDETPELMPLPILLAHRLSRDLAESRKAGRVPWLRPDGKTQVAVEYEGGAPTRVARVLVSAHHTAEVGGAEIEAFVRDELVPSALGEWSQGCGDVIVNPSGSFIEGGPLADCGLTGRKVIVDTYGGMARHGGGAFSGKDASKVDRSAAYYCRHAARQTVLAGLAERAEVQVSYTIGKADPFSIAVETFGSGCEVEATRFVESSRFNFRPDAIIREFDLRQPQFKATTNYGHFGRPGLPWEV